MTCRSWWLRFKSLINVHRTPERERTTKCSATSDQLTDRSVNRALRLPKQPCLLCGINRCGRHPQCFTGFIARCWRRWRSGAVMILKTNSRCKIRCRVSVAVILWCPNSFGGRCILAFVVRLSGPAAYYLTRPANNNPRVRSKTIAHTAQMEAAADRKATNTPREKNSITKRNAMQDKYIDGGLWGRMNIRRVGNLQDDVWCIGTSYGNRSHTLLFHYIYISFAFECIAID